MRFDESALRPGQRDAVHMIETRLARGEKTTAIVLPCRYGKSDIIRTATLKMWNEGTSAAALALSPNMVLRGQLADADRWSSAIERYRITGIKSLGIAQLDKMKVPFTPNGELFLSATTQLASGRANLALFAAWIESERNRTGLPVPVFVDECHMSSDGNQWGEMVPKLTEAGAHVVLLTATADRADGKRIPGFRFESAVVEDDIKVYRCTDGKTPEMVQVDVYEGSRTTLRLVPDVEVSFRDAWDIGVLCKVSRTPFDVNLRDAGVEGEGQQLLSQLSVSQTKRVLGRLVRAPIVIEEGCLRLVDRMRTRRSARPDTQAIVFCGNDREDDGANGHPVDIQRTIRRLDASLKVVVATSAEGDGNDVLQAFIRGDGDVLVVKQMAGIGLDIGRLKIGLDLSPTRTYPAFVQRMMRPATPHEGVMSMEWISLDDVVSHALFEKLVTNQGGEAVVTDLALTDSYEKPREENPQPDPVLFPDVVLPGNFDDSGNNRADRSQWETANRLMSRFPQLAETNTHAEIADWCRGEGFGFGSTEIEGSAVEVADTGAEAATLRRTIVDLAKKVTWNRMNGQAYSSAVWGVESRLVWGEAYRQSQFPKVKELDECNDLDALRRLRGVFEEWTASFEPGRLF